MVYIHEYSQAVRNAAAKAIDSRLSRLVSNLQLRPLTPGATSARRWRHDACVTQNAEVDAAQIREALEHVFDQAIVFHGFTAYMRDYEILMVCTSDPKLGQPPDHVRLRFRNCVSANVTTSFPPAIWGQSLDDRLIDYDQAQDVNGFVWGVKWQCNFPGMTLVEESHDAVRWTEELGIPFYEARVEANAHTVRLISSDLAVDSVQPDYTPFG